MHASTQSVTATCSRGDWVLAKTWNNSTASTVNTAEMVTATPVSVSGATGVTVQLCSKNQTVVTDENGVVWEIQPYQVRRNFAKGYVVWLPDPSVIPGAESRQSLLSVPCWHAQWRGSAAIPCAARPCLAAPTVTITDGQRVFR